jgi:DNA segregation ATPase FtsK/SpoIIIE-like protein
MLQHARSGDGSALCIPEKILDQHLVVLGKTGAGKSSKLRHVVEHLLTHKKRVCVIDPKGTGGA